MNLARSFDKFHWASTVIDAEHRLVHEGFMFSLDDIQTGVTNTSSLDYLLVTPAATFPHIRVLYWVATNGPVQVFTYEDTVVSANGTLVNTRNRNRVSSNVPNSLVYRGPTVSSLGTLLSTVLMPDTGPGPSGIFGDDPGEEWVFKPNSNYMFRFTNNSGGTVNVNFALSWYELNGYGRN
jgi:hypothetical protein